MQVPSPDRAGERVPAGSPPLCASFRRLYFAGRRDGRQGAFALSSFHLSLAFYVNNSLKKYGSALATPHASCYYCNTLGIFGINAKIAELPAHNSDFCGKSIGRALPPFSSAYRYFQRHRKSFPICPVGVQNASVFVRTGRSWPRTVCKFPAKPELFLKISFFAVL